VRYRPLLALAPALLLLAGCGKAGQVTLCGGDETPQATPPAPLVGAFPRTTTLASLPIAGWRFPDTSLEIDGTEAVPAGCDRLWTATVALPAEGTYNLSLVSRSRTDNPSAATTLTIVRDATPPAAPTATPAAASTPDGTVSVTGSREAGAAVWLNGRPLVPPDGATAFTVEVALAAGTNNLSFTAVDAAGNESAATVVAVDRTGADLTPPRAVYPLDRQPVPSATLTLYWAAGAGAGLDHYQMELGDEAGFSGAYTATVATAGTTSLSKAVTLPGPGRYFWRAGSADAGGNVTYGRTRSFTVGPVPADVDGDGYSDVLANLPGWDGGANPVVQDNRGKVRLYLGGAAFGSGGTAPTETADLEYLGTRSRGEFGISVSAGDLNGDGYADVIVGAHRERGTATYSGRAHVFLGGAAPDAAVDLTLDGQNYQDGFGQQVASGFDLNADGYDDLAVSAWLHDGDTGTTGDDRGRVFVYFGGATLDAVPDLILTGGQARENFGAALGGGFDLNGDGYDDLAVGGPLADAAGGTVTGAGRVVVVYGGPWVDAVPDLTLEGTVADEHFGSTVSRAGDMDGDGFEDLAVGAPAYAVGGTASKGRVRVFKGALAPATAAALTLEGAGGCEGFGTRVSGGGDLNGDGYADLAVGIPYSDLAGGGLPDCRSTTGDYGAVEIHLGAATLDASADARFTGQADNDWLGLGLHMTADVNGDTLDDLVFGAPNNDLGSSIYGDVGRAYVLFGRAAGWSPLQQSAGAIRDTTGTFTPVPGAILPNDGGKDGLGSAVW